MIESIEMEVPDISHLISSKALGIFDKNGNEICEGYVISHNWNLFLIKWSKNQKQWIARTSEGMNWRDFNWIANIAKHCKIVGNIHFNRQFWEQWKHCIQKK